MDQHTILDMIDNVSDQSIFAECEVMMSLAASYQKESLILEEETPETGEKKKTFFQKAKHILQKVVMMFKAIINMIRRSVMNAKHKALIRIIKKQKYDVVLMSSSVQADIDWMRDTADTISESICLGKHHKVHANAPNIDKIAKFFHNAAAKMIRDKRYTFFSSVKEFEKRAKAFFETNTYVTPVDDYEIYLNAVSNFMKVIIKQSRIINLTIDQVIKAYDKEINRQLTDPKENTMTDETDPTSPHFTGNADPGDVKMSFARIYDPSRWMNLAVDMTKFATIFMQNHISEINFLQEVYQSSDIIKNHIDTNERIKSIRKDIDKLNEAIDKSIDELGKTLDQLDDSYDPEADI